MDYFYLGNNCINSSVRLLHNLIEIEKQVDNPEKLEIYREKYKNWSNWCVESAANYAILIMTADFLVDNVPTK